MSQRYSELSDRLTGFIKQQKLFFVATAAADGRINLSPKGMNSLKVVNSNKVIWLNVTGSGNETAAHLDESSRMTLMFCSFEGAPLILRVYGRARAIYHKDSDWADYYQQLEPLPGARQIFELTVELVQTSCGTGVPLYDYVADRDMLNNWNANMSSEAIRDYWRENNQLSIDNRPTHIMQRGG